MTTKAYFAKGAFTRVLISVLIVLAFGVMISACGSQVTASPVPQAESATDTGSQIADISPTVQPEATPEPQSTIGAAAGDVASTVTSRTPVPTPTPSRVDQKINQFTESVGIAGDTFLGLSVNDWINIIISVLIVLLGYLLGGSVLTRVLRWFVGRTGMTLDDKLLNDIGEELQWMVVIVFARYAVMRLEFITGGFRTLLDDIFFILLLAVITIVALKLVNFAVQTYMTNYIAEEDQNKLDAVLTMVRRLGYFLVIVVALSIAMDHFGFNVSVLSFVLLVFGVIVALGAKNMVSDIISGFIILVDQPFRVGDTILIEKLNTSGTVQTIGTRTTRIATGDKREVMIPNSQISESQVVNYSHPDPRFRCQTTVGVAYGTDTDQVHKVITDAVRGVEGVLPDKPVNVFFLEFGDSTKTIRVRWWIDSYSDEYPMLDKVNAAIEVALAKASIDMPFNTYELDIVNEGEEAGSHTPASFDTPSPATTS